MERIPCNLKCVTSRTIRQPKLHPLLRGDEKALSEHQWAYKSEVLDLPLIRKRNSQKQTGFC